MFNLKTNKKILTLIFSTFFIIGISGCGNNNISHKSSEASSSTSNSQDKEKSSKKKQKKKEKAKTEKEVENDSIKQEEHTQVEKKADQSNSTENKPEAPHEEKVPTTSTPTKNYESETTNNPTNNQSNNLNSQTNGNTTNKQNYSSNNQYNNHSYQKRYYKNPNQQNNQGYTFLDSNSGPVIGDSKTHIYHLPTQKNFKIRSDHFVRFGNEQEAKSNGYRMSKR